MRRRPRKDRPLRALIMDLSQGGAREDRRAARRGHRLQERPEVRVYPDRVKAYARGVSIQSIGTTINAMIGGVRSEPRYRLAPEDIDKFYVRNNRGEMIRLSEVVKLETRPSLLAITRKDRERAIGIFANIVPGKSQAQILTDIEKLGRETFALVLGVLIAYMVLGAQFNSFVHPVTVLLALPFSLSGAFLTLWAFDRSLNPDDLGRDHLGGVSVSTFLTLFVVPAAYSLFVRLESGKALSTYAAVIRAVRQAERAEDECVNPGR